MARAGVLVLLLAGLVALGASLPTREQRGWISSAAKMSDAYGRTPVKPTDVVVNLDLPAEERWVEVGQQFSSQSHKIKDYVTKFVPAYLWPVIERISADIRPYFKDYGDEMVGYAKGLGVPVGDVVVVNLIYQLEQLGMNCSQYNVTGPTPNCPPKKDNEEGGPGLCTSLVTTDKQSHIIHGRNLDWNMDDTVLDLVINVHFQRSNKTIFTTTQVVGELGSLHGMKKGGFAISLNARGRGGNILVNILEALTAEARTPTQHLRYVLENSDSFEEAVGMLGDHALVDEVYYTVSGKEQGEGAIVTRSRNKAADVWTLHGSTTHFNPNNTQQTWFKLQTNYDHWEIAPPEDDRRTPGVENVMKTGQAGMDMDSLYTVLTTWPTFNHHTDITGRMSVFYDIYENVVWRDSE